MVKETFYDENTTPGYILVSVGAVLVDASSRRWNRTDYFVAPY